MLSIDQRKQGMISIDPTRQPDAKIHALSDRIHQSGTEAAKLAEEVRQKLVAISSIVLHVGRSAGGSGPR